MGLQDNVVDKTNYVPKYCPYCSFHNTILIEQEKLYVAEKRLCRKCKKKFRILYEEPFNKKKEKE